MGGGGLFIVIAGSGVGGESLVSLVSVNSVTASNKSSQPARAVGHILIWAGRGGCGLGGCVAQHFQKTSFAIVEKKNAPKIVACSTQTK